jgi:hypothetical protein
MLGLHTSPMAVTVTTYSQARTLWHNRNRAHLAELESSAAIDNLQTILPENAEFVSTTFGLEYVLMVAEKDWSLLKYCQRRHYRE